MPPTRPGQNRLRRTGYDEMLTQARMMDSTWHTMTLNAHPDTDLVHDR